MQTLTSADQVDALHDAPVALIYKHSTRCPISAMAHEQVEELLRERPDAPVYVVDVNAHRAVSQHVAARLRVEHHSPQAILLVRGEPVWHVTHFQVRTDAMRTRLDAALEQAADGAETDAAR